MEKGVRLEYVNGRNGVVSTIDNWICIDVALREAIDPIRISVRGGTATSREFSEMRRDHFFRRVFGGYRGVWCSAMLRLLIILAAVMTVSQPGFAEASEHLQRLRASTESRLRIERAKVSTEDQASKIALQAYFKKMGGLRALQTAKVVSVHRLDVKVKGFARKGDRVWEVRIYGLRDLRAVIWVHSESAKTFFLMPRGE